jgi:hypothetical protein
MKKTQKDKGMAACQEPLKARDQTLDKVRETEAAETQMKILESSWNRLWRRRWERSEEDSLTYRRMCSTTRAAPKGWPKS